MNYIIVFLITILLPIFSYADSDHIRTITVKGYAEEKFAPDIARFSVTVTAKEIDKRDAKSQHDRKLKTLLKLLDDNYIEQKDIKTIYSSVQPNYQYYEGKRKFLNYVATTRINIILRDLKKVGQFQEIMVSKDFGNFVGPNYMLEHINKYKDKILTLAVANAKQKANNIAASIGEELGRPVSIKEEGVGSSNIRYKAAAMLESASDRAVQQPIGMLDINSNVVVTFQIK